VYLAIKIIGYALMAAWVFATAYIISPRVIFYVSFLGGKGKSMRVIELEQRIPKTRSIKLGRVTNL
jgi:hypothetical protein